MKKNSSIKYVSLNATYKQGLNIQNKTKESYNDLKQIQVVFSTDISRGVVSRFSAILL